MSDLETKITQAQNIDSIKIGNFRWTILSLIFLVTTINYVDHHVIGILAPTLQKEIGWNEIEYGYIVAAFTAAYAIGMLVVGRIIDIIGTKEGYALVLTGWSFAAIGHALAKSAFGFGIARFALGLFEREIFLLLLKLSQNGFRKKRALATGIFNAGTNVGGL